MRFAAALLLAAGALIAQPVHETCVACHQEQVKDFLRHAHGAKLLSCDACHGKSEKHRDAAGGAAPDRVAAPDEQPAMCGTCHSGPRKGFEASEHGKLVLARAKVRAPTCTTCHGVHAPRAAAAMEVQCGRCHTSLPESCKASPVHATNVRCAGCHDRHTMSISKK